MIVSGVLGFLLFTALGVFPAGKLDIASGLFVETIGGIIDL